MKEAHKKTIEGYRQRMLNSSLVTRKGKEYVEREVEAMSELVDVFSMSGGDWADWYLSYIGELISKYE